MAASGKKHRIGRSALWACVVLGSSPVLYSSAICAASNSTTSNDAEQVAKDSYEKAIELSEQGAYSEALVLFHRAYAAAPHYAVLYNIAQVEAVLGQDPLAIETYSRYLKQGGSAVSAARREEVLAAILRLELRIGQLQVTANPVGAQVLLDGIDVGPAPLQLRVASGSHTVTVVSGGYQWKSQRIDVPRGKVTELNVTLDTPSAPSAPPASETLPTSPASPPSQLAKSPVHTQSALVQRTEPNYVHRNWAYIFGGTTLVFAGASLTAGLLARHEASQYHDQQVELNGACFFGRFDADLAEAQEHNNRLLDKAHRLDMATVGFAVAATATLVASITLYLTHNRPIPKIGANAPLRVNQPLTWNLTF